MWDDLEKGLKKFDNFTNVKYKERDAFLSLKYDLVEEKEFKEDYGSNAGACDDSFYGGLCST